MNDGHWRKPPTKPYRARDPATTSRMMAKVRSRNTKPEMMLRRELWARGHRYRLHDPTLPGRPDLVFKGRKVAVFVDSDWWHGRILLEEGETGLRAHLRTKRQDWWVAKLTRTVARDAEVTDALRARRWKVIRVWESDVLKNPVRAADAVARVLEQ